jgi:alpha-L-fucosidase 2
MSGSLPELWYEAPAAHWEEALPMGNGRIGAMAWAGPRADMFSLNEDTLWSGYPRDPGPPGASVHYRAARELARQGRLPEAQRLLEERFLGSFTEGYLPLGDLELLFPDIDERAVSGYRRSLGLTDAVCGAAFSHGGIAYRREAFVSHPAQAMAVRISADTPGRVSFSARFSCQLMHGARAEGSRLYLEGRCPSHVEPAYIDCAEPVLYDDDGPRKGMSFFAALDVAAQGGRVTARGDSLSVEGADCAVLLFAARTSFAGHDKHPHLQGLDPRGRCLRDLEAASGRTYDELKAAHIDDYRKLFGRVGLSFGPGLDHLPTDRRLGRKDKTGDASLYALLFHYGRYLLISCSRPGTLAANLQGIWNREVRPPWSSNYTVNINTQMNYWPAESCNLSELHEPLFDLLGAVAVTGAKAAKSYYGASGFTAHHNIDIWAHPGPVGGGRKGAASYAFWPMSAGWLCAHLMERYRFTRDKAFLEKRAFPLICGAARFFLDVLAEDGAGRLAFCPTTSPENSFELGGEACAVSASATMTEAIVAEVLGAAVFCCGLFGQEPGLRERASAALGRMPAYRIGAAGQLLEWDKDYPEHEPRHRHTSHLYPLYPGHGISPGAAPGLAEACRKSLLLRGDEGTGWALAWRVNLWARLGEGDRAFALLTRQLRLTLPGQTGEAGGSYANLFGAHPPFQIDSNFGAAAGIAEMLLQSGEGWLRLLPALPKALPEGHVSGLRARGGCEVDIRFRGGALEEACIRRVFAGDPGLKVIYGKSELPFDLRPGGELRLKLSDFTSGKSAIWGDRP